LVHTGFRYAGETTQLEAALEGYFGGTAATAISSEAGMSEAEYQALVAAAKIATCPMCERDFERYGGPTDEEGRELCGASCVRAYQHASSPLAINTNLAGFERVGGILI